VRPEPCAVNAHLARVFSGGKRRTFLADIQIPALPKTSGAVREVPIEPTLLPLLKAIHEARANDDAPVVRALRTMHDTFRAKQLREHVKRAGVTRARLEADTLTLRPINFRSCRDTGITWLALAGVD
jgi:hypothetical protein